MRWSTLLGLAVVALLIAAPFGLPVFAMTLLTELVILGLFAMSLDLMVGYTRLVSFGHVAAYGLGAYIARATEAGDFHRVVLGVAVMSLFVTVFNRSVWRPLYAYAERRLRLD